MEAFNLVDARRMTFSAGVDPVWAVMYAACEESQRMSWLFSHRDAGTIGMAQKELGVQRTASGACVCCGDWAAATAR